MLYWYIPAVLALVLETHETINLRNEEKHYFMAMGIAKYTVHA
jgi:hypothetical protein